MLVFFGLFYDSEDSDMFFRNVYLFSTDYTALYLVYRAHLLNVFYGRIFNSRKKLSFIQMLHDLLSSSTFI
jgi:hypothetical protein